jgi:hypothetical protein
MPTHPNGVWEVLDKASQMTDREFLSTPKQMIKDAPIETLRSILPLLMTRICVLSGIKEEIDNLNAQDISKMILSRYKTLSVFEINKAFELERYSAYDRKTDHFQLFNAEYVGEILKKYQNWKKRQYREQNIPMPDQLVKEAKKELPVTLKSEEEWAEEIKEEFLKTNQMPSAWFKYWLSTWKYFHGRKDEMQKHRRKAEILVKDEYRTMRKFNFGKPKPTEKEIKRKMAELSLIELWRNEN